MSMNLGGALGGATTGSAAGPWGAVAGAGIGAVSSLFSGKNSNNAQQYAIDQQIQATNRAADLQAKSAADALAFEKQKEADAQRQFESTQKQNYDIWAAETAYQKELEAAKRARLQPFVNLGVGSLGQMASGLPSANTSTYTPGSLGSLVK